MVLSLGVRYAKPIIIKTVVEEFIKRGLDKVCVKEIAGWQKYYREQKFTKKLNKKVKKERERFKKELERWKPDELKEFVIRGLDCLK